MARRWWLIPLVPALGRQRRTDLCEIEASLVYRVSSRTVRAIWRSPVSTNKQTNKIPTNLCGELWKEREKVYHVESVFVCFNKALLITHSWSNAYYCVISLSVYLPWLSRLFLDAAKGYQPCIRRGPPAGRMACLASSVMWRDWCSFTPLPGIWEELSVPNLSLVWSGDSLSGFPAPALALGRVQIFRSSSGLPELRAGGMGTQQSAP